MTLLLTVTLLCPQLRRQGRLRREYLYRKGVEQREKAIQDKKDRLKRAIEGEDNEVYSLKISIMKSTLHFRKPPD